MQNIRQVAEAETLPEIDYGFVRSVVKFLEVINSS